WRNDEKTASSFVEHAELGRLYKTGDLGRWHRGGYIEFEGRVDNQVKVNGYRIELGEIKHKMELLAEVSQSIVLCDQGGSRKSIIAYYIPSGVCDINDKFKNKSNELIDKLSALDLSVAYKKATKHEMDKFISEIKNNELNYLKLLKEACIELSLFQEVGFSIDIDSVIKLHNIADRYRNWFGRAFDYLESNGYIKRVGHSYHCLRRITISEKDYKKVNHPLSSEKLISMLKEDVHSASIYAESNAEKSYDEFFGEIYAISKLIFKKLLENFSSSKKISILEVGSGYGTFTKLILDCLKRRGNVEYDFTDISKFFFDGAKSKFKEYDFLNYTLYDLDRPAAFQEVNSSYDIIIAVSVLHDVKNLKYSLNELASLLKPKGGILFAIEETKFYQFFNLGMGLQSGFDNFSDYRSKNSSHPLVDVTQWKKLLLESGFSSVKCFTPENSFSNEMGFNTIVASTDIGSESESKSYFQEKLTSDLPEYMIPEYFIKLNEFPISESGKINAKVLPMPDIELRHTKYVAPRTEKEAKVCAIWQDVLRIDNNIGMRDDFFDNGGDSLLLIRLVSLTNIAFKCQLSVKDCFTHRTVEQFIHLIASSQGDFKYNNYLITDCDASHLYDAFPLTNVQQSYLYGRSEYFEMGSTSTHSYSELLFDTLDSDRLEQALTYLIQRHPALRTIFLEDTQAILKSVPPYKVSNHGIINEPQLCEIRQRLSHKIYDVSCFPLFDFEVSRHKDETILHMSIDALIMDGTSFGIFMRELAQLYNAKDIASVELAVLPVTFRDYMESYTKIRASHLLEAAKTYWVNKLEDYEFDMKLPMLSDPATIKRPIFARQTKLISKVIWEKLKAKAKYHQVSRTSIVLFAYGLVLSRWSGSASFCINLTLFNRLPLHEKVNDILGDFTVLELFNFKRSPGQTIASGVNQVHQDLWKDIDHNLFDGIDFQRLIRHERGIPPSKSLSPVVLTSILSGNAGTDANLKGYKGRGYSITQTTQVYLDNKAYELEGGLVAEWDYIEQLFDKEVIECMHRDYCELLESLATQGWQEVIPSLLLPERDSLVIDQANSASQAAVTETLVEMCDKCISAYSDAIAVIDVYGEHKYKEIGLYSRRIANYLHCNQSSDAELIGILSEKGYLQVVSAIGIMASGSAYLPLHVEWPEGRIDEVLIEGGVSQVLVSSSIYHALIKGSEREGRYDWIMIEDLINNETLSVSDTLLPRINLDDNAYVIFTSGSTGKPKGVAITHRGVVNTLLAVNRRFGISSSDRVLALSELSFDLSVYDIFGMLAAGGAIVFPEQSKTKDLAHWYNLIRSHDVTVWNSVPQLMQLLVDYVGEIGGSLELLRVVLMSGDWIPLNLPDQIRSLNSDVVVMSLGGATEGSIWSIWYEVGEIVKQWTSIPYGVAMPNQKMYVLSADGEHCPVGVLGEIHIGGVGVASCYWRNDEKTASSFVEHAELGRLYKTGDLGRWHRGGYIEFEGRVDNQVKV
ncbi:MAG: AMP-binding protein, partial [Pseudomonadota bacterium]